MITVDCIQGSPEWFAARCGIPTASNFDKIITTKGEPSKQARKYMLQMAVERITGRPDRSYSNATMQQASELEAEARNLYEMMHDVQVVQVGLCYPSELKMCAASPDGLVGEDGLLEIKCPESFASAEYILDGVLPTEYIQQTQGQLYVTGRTWLDFLSYYPGMKPFIVRVTRDEKFISALSVELAVFNKNLTETIEKLK